MTIYIDAIAGFAIAVAVGSALVTAFEAGLSRARRKDRSRLGNDAAVVARGRARRRWARFSNGRFG